MEDSNLAALRIAAILVALMAIFWFFVGADSAKGPQLVRTYGAGGGCGVGVFFGCR